MVLPTEVMDRAAVAGGGGAPVGDNDANGDGVVMVTIGGRGLRGRGREGSVSQ